MAKATAKTVSVTTVTIEMSEDEAAMIGALIGRTVNAGLQDVYDALKEVVSSSNFKVTLKDNLPEAPTLYVKRRKDADW